VFYVFLLREGERLSEIKVLDAAAFNARYNDITRLFLSRQLMGVYRLRFMRIANEVL